MAEPQTQQQQAAAEKSRALAEEAKPTFEKLRKSLKQIALYRHNVDRYGEYLDPFVTGLKELLAKHNMISLKVDPVAYKIGQMKISELRDKAKRELGPKFDLREYDDAVLETGSVPLDALERHIDAWIAARKA